MAIRYSKYLAPFIFLCDLLLLNLALYNFALINSQQASYLFDYIRLLS